MSESGRFGDQTWYSKWFNLDYLALYAGRNDAEAEAQGRFICSAAPPADFPNLLDCGCGAGRHLAVLSKSGYRGTGIDLSADLLSEAKRRVLNSAVCLVRGDMRALPFSQSAFDLVTSLFTSFGYFDSDEEHAAVAAEWRRVVRPDGRVILDYLNPETAVAALVPEEEKIISGRRVLISRRYDASANRLIKEISIIQPGGEEEHYRESVRLFSQAQLSALLKEAGFPAVSSYGDFDGGKFGPNSPRLILVAH